MLFIYPASARYDISDYSNILPHIPDGKKYKQGEEREGEKKTHKNPILSLTFSARPGSSEWRSGIPCTRGIPKTIIKILVPNPASTCQEEYPKYQRSDAKV